MTNKFTNNNKRVKVRSKSCPHLLNEQKKFPLFLSEDDIKIPSRFMISISKETKQSFCAEMIEKPQPMVLKYEGNSKTMSEEPKIQQNELMNKSIKLNDSNKKEALFIPLEENYMENNKIDTPMLFHEIDNGKKENELEDKTEDQEGKTDSFSEKSKEEKNLSDDELSESEEIFKHFNPNNLLKTKKFRKGSSTSVNDTPEWLILMDLMKGICEWEPENEFKSTKFYVNNFVFLYSFIHNFRNLSLSSNPNLCQSSPTP